MPDHPLAYLLTWTCHGTWLHGDQRGSVDRHNNKFGHPRVEPDEWVKEFERRLLSQPVDLLSERAREVVQATIAEVCAHRKWRLLAKHVGRNHVHTVLAAHAAPDKMAEDLKAWSTRRLREAGESTSKPWTEGASTIYLWSHEHVAANVDYVTRLQTGPVRAKIEQQRRLRTRAVSPADMPESEPDA
jgi:REP element-mobilizing transposase RayT